jgi:hypothetical protein
MVESPEKRHSHWLSAAFGSARLALSASALHYAQFLASRYKYILRLPQNLFGTMYESSQHASEEAVEILLIVLVVFFLFAGGGYYGYRRWR